MPILRRWPRRRPRATTVVVSASMVLAPSSYARLRLLRRLHASGMLRDETSGAPGSA